MAQLNKRARQLQRQAFMSPTELSLAVNDVHNAAIRAGHGVARCGNSLECWRCGASCTVNDVDGSPVTVGTLHARGCR